MITVIPHTPAHYSLINRSLFTIFILAATIAALALRLPRLAQRPMHGDEAVALVTDKYVAPAIEGGDVNLAAFIALRLADLGG